MVDKSSTLFLLIFSSNSIPISLKNILTILDILDGFVISISHELNVSGSKSAFFYSSHYSKYPKYFTIRAIFKFL